MRFIPFPMCRRAALVTGNMFEFSDKPAVCMHPSPRDTDYIVMWYKHLHEANLLAELKH